PGEDGGVPLAGQRARAAQRGRAGGGAGRGADARRGRRVAVRAGGASAAVGGGRGPLRGGGGGGRGGAAPRPDAGAHGLEQESGGEDPPDRALDAGPQDQLLRPETLRGSR